MKSFWVTSLFGAASHQGIVELHYQDWSLQVDTETARQIAHDILAAAETADQDHFIYEFFQEHLDDQQISHIFHAFRTWRANRRKDHHDQHHDRGTHQ